VFLREEKTVAKITLTVDDATVVTTVTGHISLLAHFPMKSAGVAIWTYLVRMVDLSSMSRHGPTERPQPFGIVACAAMLVAWVTLGYTLTRFNGHTHNYQPLDP
jgi:hypothetical protein